MKVSFIYPRFEKFLDGLPELNGELGDYFLGDFTTPPSLGIPTLAAHTPPDIEIELLDDNSGDIINYDAPTDLVAINCFTPQATRAFEIADEFRRHGKKVIMGGLFPTFMPDECLLHADSVNVGEGEPTWPQILRDAQAGKLKPRYLGGSKTDLATSPIPRREIFYNKESYDWDEDLVQVTRGCIYTCGMCSLPAQMGGRIRYRPVELVVEELKSLKYENVYLADDTLFFEQGRLREYARQLFEAITPLNKKFFVSSTMALNTDTKFLDLAARAGVKNYYCTMNVDPVSIRALQGEQRERQSLRDLVRALEDRDIRFFASCGLGRDWDNTDIADRILDLFGTTGVRTAEFFVFTPYPGSVHWERMERQGRIFDRTWRHYNGAHVVAQPLNMTPDQLRDQLIKVWRGFHSEQREKHVAYLEPATYQNGQQVVGKPLVRKGVRGQAAITGIGLLSPIGNDTTTVTDALRNGRHGLVPISRFDAGMFRTKLAGEIKNFAPPQFLTDDEIRKFEDPYLIKAIAAARQAVRDAQLPWDDHTVKPNVALVLGTCNGGLSSAEAEYAWKHGKASRAFDEMMNLESQHYGFGKALADALKIGGDTWVVTTACSATTAALGLAQRLINRGYYDTVIVGGADVLCVANMSGFDALKVTSTDRTAPFSIPPGLNIGEAACFWVLEEMETALLRNARCLGRIVGHATSSDAYHPTTPDPRGDGVYRVLRNALADSGLNLTDLGCINAHGTGTESNDKAESRGITKFIGNTPLPVVSTKSFFGHCMGATGILEATCQLLAMNNGFIPPTLNFTEPRPGCTLDYVPNQAREKQYRAFLSSNYAFGGNNAAIVVADRDITIAPRPPAAGRVVITGLGTATAAGLGVTRLLETLRRNETCLTPATRYPLLACRSRLAGFVPDFKSADVDRRLDFSVLNEISRFAVAAARLALAHGDLRVGPGNAEQIGVTMGVCNGPSEMGHMDKVFSTAHFEADLNSFSNITANSTAGWVSNLLCLKGDNISLSGGPHAGLQAMAYAFDTLAEKRTHSILAMAADEVYAQTYYNYDGIGFLYSGEAENNYQLRPDEPRRKVLGEGAAALLLETATTAAARGAKVLAEILGYGLSMDAGAFNEQNLATDGLKRAVQTALTRSQLTPSDIGLIVWAPQGNRQDKKMLDVAAELFPGIPLVTTTFNTGYIESTSILVSLAAALEALRGGTELWPQRTGLPEIDNRRLTAPPKHILCFGSTDVGYNSAVIVRPIHTQGETR